MKTIKFIAIFIFSLLIINVFSANKKNVSFRNYVDLPWVSDITKLDSIDHFLNETISFTVPFVSSSITSSKIYISQNRYDSVIANRVMINPSVLPGSTKIVSITADPMSSLSEGVQYYLNFDGISLQDGRILKTYIPFKVKKAALPVSMTITPADASTNIDSSLFTGFTVTFSNGNPSSGLPLTNVKVYKSSDATTAQLLQSCFKQTTTVYFCQLKQSLSASTSYVFSITNLAVINTAGQTSNINGTATVTTTNAVANTNVYLGLYAGGGGSGGIWKCDSGISSCTSIGDPGASVEAVRKVGSTLTYAGMSATNIAFVKSCTMDPSGIFASCTNKTYTDPATGSPLDIKDFIYTTDGSYMYLSTTIGIIKIDNNTGNGIVIVPKLVVSDPQQMLLDDNLLWITDAYNGVVVHDFNSGINSGGFSSFNSQAIVKWGNNIYVGGRGSQAGVLYKATIDMATGVIALTPVFNNTLLGNMEGMTVLNDKLYITVDNATDTGYNVIQCTKNSTDIITCSNTANGFKQLVAPRGISAF